MSGERGPMTGWISAGATFVVVLVLLLGPAGLDSAGALAFAVLAAGLAWVLARVLQPSTTDEPDDGVDAAGQPVGRVSSASASSQRDSRLPEPKRTPRQAAARRDPRVPPRLVPKARHDNSGGAPAAPVTGSLDDLTQLRGVDTEMAARLRSLGVTSLTMVAAWSADEATRIGDEVGAPPRMAADVWIDQARAAVNSAHAAQEIEGHEDDRMDDGDLEDHGGDGEDGGDDGAE